MNHKLRLNPYAAALLPLTVPGAAFGVNLADIVSSNGVGSTGTSVTGNTTTTTIVTNTNAATINWQQFSVGGQEVVVFTQPSASSAVLNRVIGGNATEILGSMQSNGQVFIVNPNGILFGQGSQVNVGGLVATTMDVTDADFQNGDGKYVFVRGQSQSQTAHAVRNQGSITATDGGFVVLAGDAVTNSGMVQAELGDVLLASGAQMTLTFQGSEYVGYVLDAPSTTDQAVVNNFGQIIANGGKVVMAAKVARDLIATVVNHSGSISATGIDANETGVYLTASGGHVEVDTFAGIDVSASDAVGAREGVIDVRGDRDVTLNTTNGLSGALTVVAGETATITETYGGVVVNGSVTARDVLITGRGIDLRGDVSAAASGGTVTVRADSSGGSAGVDFTNISGDHIYITAENGLVQGGNLTGGSSVTVESINLNASDDAPDGYGGFNGPVSGIDVGDVTASSGTVDLHTAVGAYGGSGGASYGISAGNVVAGQAIRIREHGADVSLGNLIAGSSTAVYTRIDVTAYNGRIAVGSVSASGRGVSASLDAGEGGLLVDGTATVHSYGGSGGLGGEGAVSSDAYLYLRSNEDVTVTGDISVTADAYTGTSSYGGVVESTTSSFAEAYVFADRDIYLQGSSNGVRAVGDAVLDAEAGRNLSIVGNTTVQADAAEYSYTDGNGTTTEARGGYAVIALFTDENYDESSPGSGEYVERPTEIRTGDLTARGPQAHILMESGKLVIGDGDAATAAMTAEATTGANGAFYRTTQQGVVSQSSYGKASILAGARLVNADGPSLSTVGGIVVKGPTATARLYTPGDIVIGGTASIQASGYQISGDWDSIDPNFVPGYFDYYGGGPIGSTPILDEGDLTWGSAGLQISGYYGNNDLVAAEADFPRAGNVLVQGDIEVGGIGSSVLQVYADSLDLDVGGARGDIAVGAQAGLVLGRFTQVEYPDGINAYEVTRSIDNGSGGAARYGLASAEIVLGDEGRAEIGDIALTGLSNQLDFSGGQVIDLGNVSLAGATGAAAPVFRMVTRYVGIDDGQGQTPPPRAAVTTVITGDGNTFGVSFDDVAGAPPASFSAGNISISGTGDNALGVRADAITTGVITLSAEAGRVVSDDPSLVGDSIDRVSGDVGLALLAGNDAPGISQIGGLSITTPGNVILGLDTHATGNVAIAAGGRISQVLDGYFDAYEHPLQSFYGYGYYPAPTAPGGLAADITFERPRIDTDGDLTLSFGADSVLDALVLNADGTLSLDSGGRTLNSEGAIELGGGTVNVSHTGLITTLLQVRATQALSFLDNTLQVGALDLQSAGALNYTQTGALTLGSNATLRGAQVTLTGASIAVDAASITALSSFTANTGGALSFNGATLVAPNVTLNSTAALSFNGSLVGRTSITFNGAQGVTLGSGATLGASQISIASSGGAVALNGAGLGSITAPGSGTVGITGRSVSLSGARIGAGSITLTSTAGALTVDNNSTIAASTAVNGRATGNVTLRNSSISGGAQDIATTGGTLALQGATLSGTSGRFSSTGDLTAASVQAKATTLNYSQSATLSSSGGAVVLDDATVNGGNAVDVAGRSVTLNSADVGGSAVTLTGSAGDLTITNGSTVAVGQTLNGRASANVAISNSSISGGAQDIATTGGTLALQGATLSGTSGRFSSTGDLTAASVQAKATTLNYSQSATLSSSGGAVVLDDATVNGGNAVDISGRSVTLNSADVGGSAVTLTASAGDLTITNGSTVAVGQTLTGRASANVAISGSSISGGAQDIAASAGTLTLQGATLSGTSGRFSSTGNLSAQGLAGTPTALNYSQLLTMSSSAGALSLTDTNIGPVANKAAQLKVAGGGNVTLSAANQLLLRRVNLQGGAVNLTGASILLDQAVLSGGAMKLIASNGSVSDGGQASSINADGLGIQSTTLIDLLRSSLVVGTGSAGLGGDVALIQALSERELAPDASTPNAAFIAPQAVRLGSLQVTGDYLYFNSDRFELPTLNVRTDALLQFLPATDTSSVGVEQAQATSRDINLAISGVPGTNRTFVIGGSGFKGDVYIGENGPIDALDNTNIVVFTSGRTFNPQNLVTTGEVIFLGGGSVIRPVERSDDEIGAIQNLIGSRGPDEIALGPQLDDRGLIEQQSGADTALVCQ